jgi:hypothetical protein
LQSILKQTQSNMLPSRFIYRLPLAVLVYLNCIYHSLAQPNYTADDQITPYTGLFAPGYNQGFYNGWNDQTLGNLAAGNQALGIQGVGAKSIRQGLYFELLRTWGNGVRLPEVQHYKALGMSDMTALILGGGNGGTQPAPPNDVRDMTEYCPGSPSELFANMYLPIWDNGAGGTPYNDQNHYAKFLYETVVTYKPYIKFWEIWNEPGFDYTGNIGWRPAGDPVGNWWDRDPIPCEYKLRAPIEHYVRMLRISYEVIKTVDPTAYVYMSSPGFPSFLDAVLRNTDNPNDGSITTAFPKKGGAYFDGIAYHSYPHFDGSTTIDAWTGTYLRNSDQCALGTVKYRDNLQSVLNTHGYNGSQKPKKEFIVTEINLPRKQFSNPSVHFGSEEAQRNFLIKAFVVAKKERIHQLHVYLLAEQRAESQATYEFDLMGLYKNINGQTAAQVQKTQEGIAWKTVSDQLWMSYHDAGASFQLNLPTGVRGEAFKRPDGRFVYVLWAECKNDGNETATANYTFPTSIQIKNAEVFTWNASAGVQPTQHAQLTQLSLTGAPVFVLADVTTTTQVIPELVSANCSPNPVTIGQNLAYRFELSAPAICRISMINALGVTVRASAEGEKLTGTQTLEIATQGLDAGVYQVVIQTDKGAHSQIVVIAN